MDTTSFWMSSSRMPKYPPLRRALEVDVVVIGGGITGITAAYLLRQSGATVALLEREHCCAIDTGHTTAHLTYVTDTRLSELVNNFGRDHAQAVWDAGLAAMNEIERIIGGENIECEFRWVPGYLHAPVAGFSGKDVAGLKEDASLATGMGFDAAFIDKVPFVNVPGIRFANQAKFHPLKYTAGLLRAAKAKGCHIFERSAVEEIQESPLAVKANGHLVKCKYVAIATHVPLQGVTGTVSAALFQTKLSPYTSYAIRAKIPKGIVPEASFWDTRDPYDYLRIDRRRDGDYAIFGGNDHKTGQNRDTAAAFGDLEARLKRIIPGAEVDHRWSGQVIETSDGLPFIGETAPKQFVSTGYSGNGMTFGALGAMMARDAFNKRANPWASLLDVNRKVIRGGVWDYVKENKDYPYYFIKDRLAAPEALSLRRVKRGEGKIVLIKGKKLAAFRDDSGKVSLCSAICPHMGCIVRWNPAEKTWDCPCHGSRFKAGGDVIAGPAESPLKQES